MDCPPLGGGMLTGRHGSDRDRPTDSRLAGIGGAHEQGTVSEGNLAIADALNAISGAASLAYGNTLDRIDDHRKNIDALV